MNTTNIATRLLAGTLFTALISSVSAIAGAAEDAQKAVPYTELSASSTQGATALYNRIRMASAEVCSRLDHGDLASKLHMKTCMNKAIVDAVGQVNQPALTAVYNARNGGSLPTVAAAR
jgi:UrcA family protein